MDANTPRPAPSSQAFHVGDFYIWAEIHYLDSASDYREYLENVHPEESAPEQPLILLDDLPRRPQFYCTSLTYHGAARMVSLAGIFGGCAFLMNLVLNWLR
jgi:hypothetical protein